MKTCALYGFISFLAGSLLLMALFFLGFHSDLDKLEASGKFAPWISLAIAIVCMVLGSKARAQEAPGTEPFGYGRAFTAAFLVSLVSTVASSAFYFVYLKFINPDVVDLMIELRIHQIEASGMNGQQLDSAVAVTRMTMGAAPQSLIGLIVGLAAGALLALLVALFTRRKASPPQALPPIV